MASKRPWIFSAKNLTGVALAAAGGVGMASVSALVPFVPFGVGALYLVGVLGVPGRDETRDTSPLAGSTVEELDRSLDQTMKTILDAGNRLSLPARTKARDLVKTLREVIRMHGALTDDVHTSYEVEKMITDYLPTTLQTYLRIDPEHARTEVGESGRTAADELIFQLDAHTKRMAALRTRLAEVSVRDFDDHGRFLSTKYRSSRLTDGTPSNDA